MHKSKLLLLCSHFWPSQQNLNHKHKSFVITKNHLTNKNFWTHNQIPGEREGTTLTITLLHSHSLVQIAVVRREQILTASSDQQLRCLGAEAHRHQDCESVQHRVATVSLSSALDVLSSLPLIPTVMKQTDQDPYIQ